MTKHLVNDRGRSETDPWSWPMAFTEDVRSWGRVHKAVHDSVLGVLETDASLSAPNRSEAMVWTDRSEIYRDLSDPGFGTIIDFGPFDALDQNSLVRETIASAKEGQRILGILRTQSGMEGGAEVGGADSPKLPNDPGSAGSIGKAWMFGALLGAAALYLSTRD
jgi:hypothetical protein